LAPPNLLAESGDALRVDEQAAERDEHALVVHRKRRIASHLQQLLQSAHVPCIRLC
jgi:hypothetical protein